MSRIALSVPAYTFPRLYLHARVSTPGACPRTQLRANTCVFSTALARRSRASSRRRSRINERTLLSITDLSIVSVIDASRSPFFLPFSRPFFLRHPLSSRSVQALALALDFLFRSLTLSPFRSPTLSLSLSLSLSVRTTLAPRLLSASIFIYVYI